MDVRKNRTNLEYVKKEFFVDGNKTICNLTFKLKLTNPPMKFFNLTFENLKTICNNNDLKSYNPFIVGEYVEFQVSARASKTANDENDPIFAERLALTRAQSKAYMVAQLFYAHLSVFFESLAQASTEMMNNAYSSFRKCNIHAVELEDRKYNN